MSKWVFIDDVTRSYPHAGKKTCTWNVYTASQPFLLGKIKWHAPWRQYCFYPADNTLYNAECMEDIAKFCRDNRTARNTLGTEQ